MMGRNLSHHTIPPVLDHESPYSRSASRKSRYQRERSPIHHREPQRGISPSSEKYSVCLKNFPEHARSPSPFSPFPPTKRFRRAEAGEVLETEQERINGMEKSWNLQEGGSHGYVRSRRKENCSERNNTDGKYSRSRHRSSPSDTEFRSRRRHLPQHAWGTRDKEKVTRGCDRYHPGGNDRRMHRQNVTDRMERMTAKDSIGYLSSRSRHDSSDQFRRSRHRSYSPQYTCDTRHVETLMEDRERNHGRGNHRSMHMESNNERIERITAKDSASHRSSRSTHGSPSDRNSRSRYRSHLPQPTFDTRDDEKLIDGSETIYSRGHHRSMHRENDTERFERLTAKENTGRSSSRSRPTTSPSNRHHSIRHRYHSPHHAGDTRYEKKINEDCQKFHRGESDSITYKENHSYREIETENLERRMEKDSSIHRSPKQSTSLLNGYHKNKHRTQFSEQAADIRAHFKVSGDIDSPFHCKDVVLNLNASLNENSKLALETSRFRADGPDKKLILSNPNGGDDDFDNEKTRSICRLNLAPRKKKLLVFDLNGLLVYRVFCFNEGGIPRDRTSDGRCGNHLVYTRPFAEEFMLFCLERFEVGIWTSAQRKNVDGVLDCVMEKLRSRLIFFWDQQQCTDSGYKSLETKMKPLYFKEMKKIWDHFEGKFSASNTLLIDDQPYKSLLNPPYSGIFLDPYIPGNGSDNALDPKKELGKYLAGLAVADDVQLYVKENPFGQPAISSEHPDWNFYSAVLRKFGKFL